MKTIIERAMEKYGFNNQVVVAVEELSELQKELCKSLRGEVSIDRIAEELADVEIMLWQVQKLFGIEDKYVQEVINFKLSRLKERLEREEQNEKTEPPLR